MHKAEPYATLFPGALRDAAVAILHAIVLVKRGYGPQPLVVQALESETFLKVGFESVQRLKVVRQRRLLLPAGRAEEFLESAVHQHGNLAGHPYARAILHLECPASFLQVHRANPAAHPDCAARLRRKREAGPLQGIHPFLKTRIRHACSTEEHTAIIECATHTLIPVSRVKSEILAESPHWFAVFLGHHEETICLSAAVYRVAACPNRRRRLFPGSNAAN